jgi:poly-gamma-glutamate capsule biosynthesis protein CapA/YwtB (metallophosphatase superfamily)
MHRSNMVSCSVLALGVLLAFPLQLGAQPTGPARPTLPRVQYDPATQIPATPLPTTVKDGFSFASVGDLIGPGRPFGGLKDPELERVAAIIRAADAASGNNEGAIFDLSTFKGYPSAQNGGGNPLSPSAVAHDLKAMGFDFLSKANNHATDFGLEGLKATEEAIEAAGLLFAGSGANRFRARAPAFLETPRGRVSFVSTATTYNPASVAGLALADMPDRPGISVIRTQRYNVVTPTEMQKLQEIAAARQAAGLEGRGRGGAAAAAAQGAPTSLTLMGQTYRLGDRPSVTYEMNKLDLYEVLRSVRGAKQVSDAAVFTIHAHETGLAGSTADFLPHLYHMVIDAGADIVAAHGQHVLRGIEIYKGKPIFYGLNHFYYMMDLDRSPTRETVEGMGVNYDALSYTDYIRARFTPSREDLQSVIAVTEFAGGKVKEVRLYPLDLRAGGEPAHRQVGVPRLADAVLGRAILETVQRESVQFGTRINIENNVGIIRIN